MNSFLIDTNIIIYSVSTPDLLSQKSRSILENPENLIYYSIASLWEITIKTGIGKLDLPFDIDDLYRNLTSKDFSMLDISVEVLKKLQYYRFERDHRDSFDRLIICQALIMKIPIITTDKKFEYYNELIFIN